LTPLLISPFTSSGFHIAIAIHFIEIASFILSSLSSLYPALIDSQMPKRADSGERQRSIERSHFISASERLAP